MIYAFDVTVSTHGLLKQGVCEARLLSGYNHFRVVLDCDTYTEAFLIAQQMGFTVKVSELANRPLKGKESQEDGDVMTTGVYLRI